MKGRTIKVSQNGWEYEGYVHIYCHKLEKVNDHTVKADGVIIEFDEEIEIPRVTLG